MWRILFFTLIVAFGSVNAIFFGGGGGGSSCCCQPSCGCAPPPPPPCSCPAPQPCGFPPPQQPFIPPQQPSYPQPPIQQPYAQPPQGYAQPQQPQGYAQPQQPQGYAQPPQGYAQPQYQQGGCQPRYIIVRPAEQISHPVSSPISAPSNYQSQPEGPPPPPPPSSEPSGGSYKSGSAPYKSARASKTVLIDARCNSAELRQVLDENIVADDANESKRRVHKAANEQFASEDGRSQSIDVICAPGAFSYRIATDFFCEHAKANITCFAYQQHNN